MTFHGSSLEGSVFNGTGLVLLIKSWFHFITPTDHLIKLFYFLFLFLLDVTHIIKCTVLIEFPES